MAVMAATAAIVNPATRAKGRLWAGGVAGPADSMSWWLSVGVSMHLMMRRTIGDLLSIRLGNCYVGQARGWQRRGRELARLVADTGHAG